MPKLPGTELAVSSPYLGRDFFILISWREHKIDEMKNNQVTLKDLAKALGISPATVSRALKDYPDISPKTKKAVHELAKKLKYRPNPIALSLRQKRSRILGVIIPEIVHNFFSTVINGIIKEAEKAGYSVLLCQSSENYEQEVREAGNLLSSRIDGLLISLSNETTQIDHIQAFIDYGIPVVLFDKVSDAANFSKVVVNDYQGSFEVMEHLIEQGCHQIALIHGPLSVSVGRDRFRGYTDALKKNGIPINQSLIQECNSFNMEEGSRITEILLANNPRPDAIFTLADNLAIGALKTIKARGLHLPGDISLVGFNDWNISEAVDPSLSAVYQPGEEMGAIATQMLLDQIEKLQKDEDYQHATRVLETRLITRNSSLRKK